MVRWLPVAALLIVAGACGSGTSEVVGAGNNGDTIEAPLAGTDQPTSTGSSDGTEHPADPETSQAGHTGMVDVVVELSDGRIASGSNDSTVQIWDPADPETTQVTYSGHTRAVRAMTELSDGRVASASLGTNVQIWNPADL